MKKFSDFAKEECPPEGTKLCMTDVLDKPILIYKWSVKPSIKNPGKKYLTLQFTLKDDEEQEKHVLFTGSGVMIDQVERYKEPEFEATITKIHKYYTFS
jgi:hypothetical protein